MATGSIREVSTKSGKPTYQVTIEGGYDELTGQRIRAFKNVKGSLREAKSVMHRMITEMEQGLLTKKSNKKVGDWMDEWLNNYLINVEETTRVGYKSKIKCYIKPAIGDIYLRSLRAEHVQRMVNDMHSRGLSPKNIRDAFNNVNAAMKKAVKLRIIPHNPCEAVELPKLKKYHANVYTTEMIQKLLNIASGTDMFLPVFMLVMVGLRRGELLALRWSDIDFDKGILKVRRNMVKGEKGFVIKSPKTESGIRDIHLGNDVMEVLREAREHYDELIRDYGYGFQDLDFVICQKDGSPYKPDSMTQKWVRFLDAHDLPRIRLHDLRHSNATALIQAGVNPRVVQQRLGHSDVNITLNTYTHVLPEMDVEAAEKLDAILLKRTEE